jgi:hypothetical protein
MSISTIIIFVPVGFILLVIISRFRQGGSNPTDDIYPTGDDSVYRVHHLGLADHDRSGNLGSRDMAMIRTVLIMVAIPAAGDSGAWWGRIETPPCA